MNLLVAHDLLDILNDPLNIVERPAVDSRQRTQRQRFEAFGHSQIVPPAHVLHVTVCRPGVQWNPHDRLLNVDEARLLQHVSGPGVVCKGPVIAGRRVG